MGQPIGNRYFLESDLVIGVGCRFTDRHTGKSTSMSGTASSSTSTLKPSQIGKVIPATVGIVSDAKSALVALLEEAKRRGYHPAPSERVKNLPADPGAIGPQDRLRKCPSSRSASSQEINHFFPPNTIFTAGCGITQIWSGQLQDIELPRRYLPSGGAGTLGYELPAGIGAKVACPNDPVVVVVGDAGLLFMAEELAMAGQHGIPIIIVVVNNGYPGPDPAEPEVRLRIRARRPASLFAGNRSSPTTSSWPRPSEAKVERIFDAKDLTAAFGRGMKATGPYLIDVMVEADADCSMGIAVNAVREFV